MMTAFEMKKRLEKEREEKEAMEREHLKELFFKYEDKIGDFIESYLLAMRGACSFPVVIYNKNTIAFKKIVYRDGRPYSLDGEFDCCCFPLKMVEDYLTDKGYLIKYYEKTVEFVGNPPFNSKLTMLFVSIPIDK